MTPDDLRAIAPAVPWLRDDIHAAADAWEGQVKEMVQALAKVVSYADSHWTHNNRGAWRVIDEARTAIKGHE